LSNVFTFPPFFKIHATKFVGKYQQGFTWREVIHIMSLLASLQVANTKKAFLPAGT
jgi:hypothetical protein